MNIYKKLELESTFIEIINPKKSNIIVGTIYKHPEMVFTKFNNVLYNLPKKINQEQTTGDFNIDLMHYNECKPRQYFLDSLPSIVDIPELFPNPY